MRRILRSKHDTLAAMRNLALGAGRYGRIKTQSLVATEDSNQVERLSLPEIRKGSHDGSEVVHIAVVLRIAWIITWGIELIDLGLQTLVCFRVGRKAVEEASESA